VITLLIVLGSRAIRKLSNRSQWSGLSNVVPDHLSEAQVIGF
jgi:hypothetical protein